MIMLIILSLDAYTTDLIRYVWNDKNPVSVMDKTLSQFDVTSYSKRSYNLSYAAGKLIYFITISYPKNINAACK